jgi:hypothetical protein
VGLLRDACSRGNVDASAYILAMTQSQEGSLIVTVQRRGMKVTNRLPRRRVIP